MAFSGNTPYGSKILLTGKILLENNYLLLDNRNCKFLGGHVDKLVDRWNAERVCLNAATAVYHHGFSLETVRMLGRPRELRNGSPLEKL